MPPSLGDDTPEVTPAPTIAEGRLAEVARRAGTDGATVRRLVTLGLVPANGSLAELAIAVRLFVALEAAGIAAETLAAAIADGDLLAGFAEPVAAEPVLLTGARFGERIAAHGVDPALVARLFVAAGLPAVDPARAVRDDDERLLAIIADALALGLSEDALTRVLRVFAQTARRAAEVMREVFRSEVEARLEAAGVGPGALPALAGARRPALQRLGFEVIRLLHARTLEDLVFENVTLQLEAALAAAGRLPHRPQSDHAVAFVDLVGFTRFTEAAGDLPAAALATRLESLAHAIASGDGGRLVKGLGDGVLLLARDAPTLRQIGARLVEAGIRAGLPPMRAGAALGPVVFRDGDVFGGTVNLASRLCTAAEPGQFLADAAFVQGDADDAGWTELGVVEVKGLGPVAAFALPIAT